MAAVNRRYLALEGGAYKLRESQGDEVIFTLVRIGGENGLDLQVVEGAWDFAAAKLSNIASPAADTDAATKGYVDEKVDLVSAGFDPKASVDYATTEALPAVTYDNGTSGVGATLTADVDGELEIDGETPQVGDRVLVMHQANAVHNGIYLVTAVGGESDEFVLTRASDFDNSPEGEISRGARTLVTYGTDNAGKAFFLTSSGTVTVGTSELAFSQAAGSVPTATSASGGGVQGKVTADEDKGLEIVDGVLGVSLGDGQKFDGNGAVANDYAETKTNDNAGTISALQIVYVKSNGNVDLATAATATHEVELGVVNDASITTTASGKVTFRRGANIPGWTGLAPGKEVFVHPSTPGSYTQDPGTITSGHLHSIGRALSATEVLYNPRHVAAL